jgi:hypothetical protein
MGCFISFCHEINAFKKSPWAWLLLGGNNNNKSNPVFPRDGCEYRQLLTNGK